MGAWHSWLEQNWFTLIQSSGIIGSILLTTVMLRRDRRSRRVSDLLTLAQHHRDLWGDLHRRPDLARVASADVDLVSRPMTTAEEEYLLLVIMHFYTGWMVAREGSLVTLQAMATDAGSFFQLPLPANVWARTRQTRDPKFVRFVDEAVSAREAD